MSHTHTPRKRFQGLRRDALHFRLRPLEGISGKHHCLCAQPPETGRKGLSAAAIAQNSGTGPAEAGMGLERLKDCPLRCQDGVGKGNTFQLQPIEKGNVQLPAAGFELFRQLAAENIPMLLSYFLYRLLNRDGGSRGDGLSVPRKRDWKEQNVPGLESLPEAVCADRSLGDLHRGAADDRAGFQKLLGQKIQAFIAAYDGKYRFSRHKTTSFAIIYACFWVLVRFGTGSGLRQKTVKTAAHCRRPLFPS